MDSIVRLEAAGYRVAADIKNYGQELREKGEMKGMEEDKEMYNQEHWGPEYPVVESFITESEHALVK